MRNKRKRYWRQHTVLLVPCASNSEQQDWRGNIRSRRETTSKWRVSAKPASNPVLQTSVPMWRNGTVWLVTSQHAKSCIYKAVSVCTHVRRHKESSRLAMQNNLWLCANNSRSYSYGNIYLEMSLNIGFFPRYIYTCIWFFLTKHLPLLHTHTHTHTHTEDVFLITCLPVVTYPILDLRLTTYSVRADLRLLSSHKVSGVHTGRTKRYIYVYNTTYYSQEKSFQHFRNKFAYYGRELHINNADYIKIKNDVSWC
jgi:hypothetical protein